MDKHPGAPNTLGIKPIQTRPFSVLPWAIFLLFSTSAWGQIITTIAGGLGDSTSAQLRAPSSITVDTDGNLYITEEEGHRVRRIDAISGRTTTIAGTGEAGFAGDQAPAFLSQLRVPYGTAIDGSGHLYIADSENSRIRRVDAISGRITTIAGTGLGGFSGDGGPATKARLGGPTDVDIDADGHLYIVDKYNSRIRKIDAATGIITTIAGDGNQNYSGDGGPANQAQLQIPHSMTIDAAGNLYIADTFNSRIRKIDAATGIITTIAGNGRDGSSGDNGPATQAQLRTPSSVAVDSAGNFYIAEWHHRIRRVDAATGIITTIAGTGGEGFSGDGGPAVQARLFIPAGIALDRAGHLYIADLGNDRIRRVDAATGIITSVASTVEQSFSGDGGYASQAQLNTPFGLRTDAAGHLYIADTFNNRIRRIENRTGIITTIAGNGLEGYAGDGGPADQAQLNRPTDIAVDAAGHLYIADTFNSRIRRIESQSGIITTVAGNGLEGYAGDGGPANQAQLHRPRGLSIDAAGHLYIADTNNNRIRKVEATTGLISTLARTLASADSIADTNSTDSLATHRDSVLITTEGPDRHDTRPTALTIDSSGNLYFAETWNHRVRRVDALSKKITTIAGFGVSGYSGDHRPANNTRLWSPQALTIDKDGHLYIADALNHRIRRVDAGSGIITTIAGTGVPGFAGDGRRSTQAQLNSPAGIFADMDGNFYIADTNNNRIRQTTVGVGIPVFSYTQEALRFDWRPFDQLTPVGQRRVLSFTGENIGELPLVLSAESIISDAFTALFAADTLAGGESVQIAVAYHPIVAGQDSAELVLSTNDPANPTVHIPLVGATLGSTGPKLAVESQVQFGEVQIGDTLTYDLAISNPGNIFLTLGWTLLDNEAFSAAPDSLVIQADSTAVISLVFTPLTAGETKASLQLRSNDPLQPVLVVELQGLALLPPEGPISLDFDPQTGDQQQRTIGQAATDKQYTLELHIADAPPISGWTAVLRYDPQALTFVEGSFQIGDFIAGQTGSATTQDGYLSLATTVFDSPDRGLGTGWLGSVTFMVLEGFSSRSELTLVEAGLHQVDTGLDLQQVHLVASITDEFPVVALPGDFNDDSVVDLEDFFLFVDSFATTDPRFDLDADGQVNFEDFFLFVDNFGRQAQAKLLALAAEHLGLPLAVDLAQNRPNPFNSQTSIPFALPRAGQVDLAIYNLTGQRIRTLLAESRPAGQQVLRWDGRDQQGRPVASGVYLYRLQIGAQVLSRKLVMTR